MNLMGCRLASLNLIYQGLVKSGQLFIGWDGSHYYSLPIRDDIGIYVLIPKLAQFLDISLPQAIDIFFYSLLIIPLLVGIVMLYLTQRLFLQKVVGVCGLILLARVAYFIGDLYLAYYAAAVIFPFVTFRIIGKPDKNCFFLTCFFIGMLSGLLHYIRAFSYFGPLLVMAFLINSSRIFLYRTQLKGFLTYLVGFALVVCFFLKTYEYSYESAKKNLGIHLCADKKIHPFWHPVYLGLGFLNIKNAYGISYDDAVGGQKVAAYDPQIVFCSKEYEETLKNEFFKILFTDPIFVLMTLFAKLGVLLFFLLKFANIGLLTAYLFPKEGWVDVAFFIGMAFSSIYVLIAVPLHEYALGFISLAVVWGIVSINYAFEHVQFSFLPQIKKSKKISPSKMQEA